MTNTLGWSATTGQVDPWVYQRISETFVLDDEMRKRLADLNPTVSSRMANRLLEASDRKYWSPRSGNAGGAAGRGGRDRGSDGRNCGAMKWCRDIDENRTGGIAHLPDVDAIRRSRLKKKTLFEMDEDEDVVRCRAEYMRLAGVLWNGTETALAHDNGPIALRYPRGSGTGVAIAERGTVLEIGRGQMVRGGEGDVAFLALGSLLSDVERAADRLEAEGLKVSIADALRASGRHGSGARSCGAA